MVTAAQITKLQPGDNVPVKVRCGGTRGTTAALAFTVGSSGLTAGAPTLSGISPASAGLDDKDVVLTVTGTNFGDSCMVNWNGVAIVTYVNSATQLTVTITPGQITAAGGATRNVTDATGAVVETVGVVAGPARIVPVAVKCGNTPATSPLMFSISPAYCTWAPTRPTCLEWGVGSDSKAKKIKNLNDFFNTNGQLSFFNQIKAIYNAASGSTTLSADLATLNFLFGMQWTVTTNAQLGSTGAAAVSSGTVPTLTSTSAAQAAQNMLWGGTVLTSLIYPIVAKGAASLSSPGGWGLLVDAIGKGGVDIQNFKSSTNINVTAPPVHASAGLEGYFTVNAINPAPSGSSSGFAGALYAGFSYGASYTSRGYARDYGFGNAVGNAIGQVSAGILLNGVAKISVSRGFGPKQSYIDNTSGTPIARYMNNFKTWSFGVTYQSSGASK
jgi:hypothetical protein